MTPEDLTALIVQHKWVALMAVLLGLVVRLLKSDTKIPINIPPQYRVWLALGLAPIAGAVDKWAAGATWTTAMVEGAIAAVLAIVGHNAVIDSLRGGKEFVIPGLIKENTPPSPGKPVSLKPPTLLLAIFFLPLPFFGVVGIEGCGLPPATIAKGELVGEEIACVIEHAFLDDPALNAACKLIDPVKQAVAKEVARAHREGVSRALAKSKAEACPTSTRVDVDGGAPKDGGPK